MLRMLKNFIFTQFVDLIVLGIVLGAAVKVIRSGDIAALQQQPVFAVDSEEASVPLIPDIAPVDEGERKLIRLAQVAQKLAKDAEQAAQKTTPVESKAAPKKTSATTEAKKPRYTYDWSDGYTSPWLRSRSSTKNNTSSSGASTALSNSVVDNQRLESEQPSLSGTPIASLSPGKRSRRTIGTGSSRLPLMSGTQNIPDEVVGDLTEQEVPQFRVNKPKSRVTTHISEATDNSGDVVIDLENGSIINAPGPDFRIVSTSDPREPIYARIGVTDTDKEDPVSDDYYWFECDTKTAQGSCAVLTSQDVQAKPFDLKDIVLAKDKTGDAAPDGASHGLSRISSIRIQPIYPSEQSANLGIPLEVKNVQLIHTQNEPQSALEDQAAIR